MLPELNVDPYTLLGWAALIGIGWNRLSAIKEGQDDLRKLFREQNSRVDKLEAWKAEREGFHQGYDVAKRRYENGEDAEATGR